MLTKNCITYRPNNCSMIQVSSVTDCSYKHANGTFLSMWYLFKIWKYVRKETNTEKSWNTPNWHNRIKKLRVSWFSGAAYLIRNLAVSSSRSHKLSWFFLFIYVFGTCIIVELQESKELWIWLNGRNYCSSSTYSQSFGLLWNIIEKLNFAIQKFTFLQSQVLCCFALSWESKMERNQVELICLPRALLT